MTDIRYASGLFIAVGITAVAGNDNRPVGVTQSPGYFTSAGVPLESPTDQDRRSDTTAAKQGASGYFPTADAPLVAPDEGNAGAQSTAQKQSGSGYFPSAGAPLVSPSTNSGR
jgi:hypothetical protein